MCFEERKISFKQAEEFFKEERVLNFLQDFWKEDKVKTFITQKYEETVKDIELIQSNLPDCFKEAAVKMWKEADYTVDIYTSELVETETIRLYQVFRYLKEFLCDNELTYKSAINSILSGGRKKIFSDMELICNLVSEALIAEYANMIRSLYFGDAMSEEVSALISMMSGKGVSITAFCPGFEEDDSDKDKKPSKKKESRKINTAKAKRGTKKK